jgi:lipid A 4'-phosphatase
MNRIGLIVTLAIAIAIGVPFGIYPRMDLAIASWFFDKDNSFIGMSHPFWTEFLRDALLCVAWSGLLTSVIAICAKVLAPGRRMFMRGRFALFLIVTVLFGPGLVTNVLLKGHWGRPRPIDVTEFGGADQFVAWWDPRGTCSSNCSFPAGEPSTLFWTLALASLAPPQLRVIAYWAALALGAADGLLRMALGAHFFTDVVFAGVLMYLVTAAGYFLIVGQRSSAAQGDYFERLLFRIGTGIRAPFVWFVDRYL